MNWKECFEARILARGSDYYERGLVSELSVDDNSVDAVVFGSEPYDVHIELHNGCVEEMYCDCPYAEENNCKHMAAVLYALESDRQGEPVASFNPVYNEEAGREKALSEQAIVDDLLETGDISAVKAFIREALRIDDDLRRRFLLRFSDSVGDDQLNECMKLVKKVFGRSYYDDYADAASKLVPVVDVLDEMTRRRQLEKAFTLATELYDDMAGWELYPDYSYEEDDWCGDLYDIADSCVEAFLAIIDGGGELADRLFDWLSERIDGIDGCEDEQFEHRLATLFTDNFNQPEQLSKKLEIIDRIVDSYDHPNNNPFCRADYQLSRWVGQRLSVMRQLGMDVSEYQRRFWRLPDIRAEHIDRLIEDSNIAEAINALNESIEIDAQLQGLVIEHTRKLSMLYQREADEQKYREMLWRLVCDCKTGSLEEYNELKALYSPDEWLLEREKVFDSLKVGRPAFLNQLYIEEDLLDRLLEWLTVNASISNLNSYFTELKDAFPAQLLELYSRAVRRDAESASSRPHYKELTSNLKTIGRLPQGGAVAREIADEWRRLYPRRRAMMDELDKAGFSKQV